MAPPRPYWKGHLKLFESRVSLGPVLQEVPQSMRRSGFSRKAAGRFVAGCPQ
jgi:hypothetical protein